MSRIAEVKKISWIIVRAHIQYIVPAMEKMTPLSFSLKLWKFWLCLLGKLKQRPKPFLNGFNFNVA
jgi:hypothetical protein